jgi:hypothetical protein
MQEESHAVPVLNGQLSVAAGAVVPNIFTGSIWEFPDRHYYGRLALTGDAAFALRATVQCGEKTQLEESQFSGANRPPILPDDLLISKFPVPRGKRLILKVRNTGAGANTVFWNLHLDPA